MRGKCQTTTFAFARHRTHVLVYSTHMSTDTIFQSSAVKEVVIIGAGIVGCATAHYLRKLNASIKIVIVDKVGVAAAASGRAGECVAASGRAGE